MLEHDHELAGRPRPACPTCGYPFDAAVGGDEPPRPGDISVCFGCATPAVFIDQAGNQRAGTDAERVEWLADPEISNVVGMILAFRAEHPNERTDP